MEIEVLSGLQDFCETDDSAGGEVSSGTSAVAADSAFEGDVEASAGGSADGMARSDAARIMLDAGAGVMDQKLS